MAVFIKPYNVKVDVRVIRDRERYFVLSTESAVGLRRISSRVRLDQLTELKTKL